MGFVASPGTKNDQLFSRRAPDAPGLTQSVITLPYGMLLLCSFHNELCHEDIGSPSHFRGVWASSAPRREAPRGRTTPRLPVNDWGNVLLACICVTSRATYKKKKAGTDGILTHSVSLIFAILTRSLKRPGSIWAAGGLISQSAFVIPWQPPRDVRERSLHWYVCQSNRSSTCWENRKHVDGQNFEF